MATEQLQIIINSKASGKGSETAKSGLDKLLKSVTLAGVAFGALKAAQAAMKFVEFGAGVQRQAQALDNLAQSAGSSGQAITSAIQGASDYTIDRMTAMSSASKAMMLDVAKTPEQFERLTKVATALGRAMGQDAAKSIDDFVTAAGRQSMQIADNLGLTIKIEAAQEHYAAQLGKTVDQLTTAENKQAFLNEMLVEGERKMGELGDTTGGAASELEILKAAVSDAKAELGEMAAAAFEGSVNADKLASSIRGIPRALKEAQAAQDVYIASLGEAEAALAGVSQGEVELAKARSATAEAAAAEKAYIIQAELASGATLDRAKSQDELTSAIVKTQVELTGFVENTAYSAKLQDDAAEATARHQAAIDQINKAAGDAAEKFAGLASNLKGATEAQIASAAISELGRLLGEGSITADEYKTAVTETQLAFGLADQASINLTDRMLDLTARLGEGTVEASSFNERLWGLIEVNKLENEQIANFGHILGDSVTPEMITATEKTGLLSDAQTTGKSKTDEYASSMSTLIGTVNDGKSAFDEYKKSLDAIPRDITVRIHQELAAPVTAPGRLGGETRQHGGLAGGLTMVGEAGREMAIFPMGSYVFNATETAQMMRGMMGGGHAVPSLGGGGTSQVFHQVFNINAAGMDARELAAAIQREERLAGQRSV